VFAKGAITTANVTMQGTGRVTVAGLQKSMTAALNGISSLFVDAASGECFCRAAKWQHDTRHCCRAAEVNDCCTQRNQLPVCGRCIR
jgi:hypothetical protein